jgi:hypothetical protein
VLSNKAYYLNNKLVFIKNDHLCTKKKLWEEWLVWTFLEGKKSLNILVSSSNYGKNDKKKFVSKQVMSSIITCMKYNLMHLRI